MAEWLVCPACQLKHSARPDGACPRCGAHVGAVGMAVAQAYAPPLGARFGAPAGPSAALLEIAAKRRTLVIAFSATLGTQLLALLLVLGMGRQVPVGPLLLLNVVAVVLHLWQLVAAFRVAEAIGASPVAWLLGIMCLPVFGWALVLALAAKANEVLRNRGVNVGFWGPRT